ERGEPAVRDAMRELAGLAHAAKDALLAGEQTTFARRVDQSFDVRQSFMALDDRHVAMVERARAAGAGANYTGSGGAIVAVCRDRGHRDVVARALAELGCSTIGWATR